MGRTWREAAVMALVVAVVGTVANLLPGRHMSWWGQGQQPPQAGKDFLFLDVDSAHSMWESLPDIVFVDSRSEAEFTTLHLPGALRLELSFLSDMLSRDIQERLTQAHAVIIYGPATETDIEQLLAQSLRQRLPGLAVPYILLGGMEAWTAAGFPVEGQP